VTSPPRPSEGTWTEHYPELGTAPVSFQDSISPEFYRGEQDAIFRQAWLNVGRVEDLPRKGSWFTKDLVAARTSVIVTRGADDSIRAFHNVCRHRGNKLVWDTAPTDEARGFSRQFVCKYHGWRYGMDGACTYVHQESEFFDVDKSNLGLAAVGCEIWAGFIFVNLAKTPPCSLREFLGPMLGALDGYPFGQMTERYSFRAENHSNWKVFIDAFQEYYHVPPLHTEQLGPIHRDPNATFEGAHYQLDGPHRVVSTTGSQKHKWPAETMYPTEVLLRSGNMGPWEASPIEGELPGINPGGVKRWGVDNFQVFPNLEILIYERNWYLSYRFWPTSHNTHVFEADLWFTPAKTARERLAREYAAITVKEYALQDAGTLNGTQLGLESEAFEDYPLNDQEILVRHFHKSVGDWVAANGRPTAEAPR
jgi:phenylpropionate dioxygenase-like ring-hydroxylating dioxygenase large terminal subunit